MQTLVFNTTTKTVKLYSGPVNNGEFGVHQSETLYSLENIPTVRISTDGYYEVMQESNGSKYPILRVPIAKTNMEIQK